MMALNTMSRLLSVLVINRITSYPFTCPEPSENYLRSKGVCREYRNYTCLFDENISSFSESCSVKFDFQRPGYRVTIRTNLHAGSCPVELYQPFIFYTNGSSDCEFKRSSCSEEGQIISKNGTTKTDRQCRCNYADGYNYVTKPANICSCIPSEEDCSCYNKKCYKNQILSPDYQCIDQFSWSGKFLCASTSDLRLPNRTVSDKIILKNSARKDELELTKATAPLVIIIIVILLLPILTGFISIQNITGCVKGRFHKHEANTQETCEKERYKSPIDAQSLITTENGIESIDEIQTDNLKRIVLNKEVKSKTEIENGMESFIETDFITKLKKEVTSKNCILLYGKPGSGKTVALQFIDSYLQTNLGFKTLHCHKPSDIFSKKNENEKHLFVFDDICGRFIFSYEMFLRWNRRVKHIESLLNTGNVKLLMTCSSAAFMTDSVQTCTLFTDNAFELSIHNWSFMNFHKGLIKLGRNNPPYKDIVENLRNLNLSAFCSLFICILKKGCIGESVLTSDDDHLFTAFGTNVFHTLNQHFSRRQLLDNLLLLMDICITKENNVFSIKHTDIFETLALYFGEKLQKVFLRYADPEIITQHCNLQTCPNIRENERFTIQIKRENEDVYFQRIKEQLLIGNISEVFHVRQMVLPLYQKKLADFLKRLGSDVVKQVFRSKCKISRETTFTFVKRYQYVTLLRLFLECDTNLRLEDYPYLEIACNTNNLSFVRFLVNKNIDINKYTSEGCTALHSVCKHGFLSIIFFLVNNKADVNCTDSQGNTPLFLVCEKGNEKVVSHLLKNGADINYSNFKGQTPLMIAARNSRTKIVDMLISNNAEVNKVDSTGMTCLMHAIKSESQNRETIRTLLQACADVNLTSTEGKTALILAIMEQREDVVGILTSDVTGAACITHKDTLINDHNVDIINKYDNDGVTPVMHACELRNDSFDVVEYLVSKGAIVNCYDANDRTPLIIALEKKDVKLVEFLVAHGAKVNSPGENKTTPLHEMCKYGHYDNVVMLMSRGSDIDIVDKQNMTPLMIASAYGYVEIVKVLIQANAIINTVDGKGATALMHACIKGFDDIIRVLVEHGAAINKRDKHNWTALFAYVSSPRENAEIVHFLIREGADVNSLTTDGVSILMMASFHGNEEIVNCLIKHTTGVNHIDCYGKTAIFWACLSGNVDIVKSLKKNGADLGRVDNNGDTLESLARKSNFTEMIDFFS